MDTRLKNSKPNRAQDTAKRGGCLPGLWVAVFLIAAASLIFLSEYPSFQRMAGADEPDFFSGSEFLHEIYQANTVLYKQIREMAAGKEIAGREIYLDAEVTPVQPGEAGEYYNFGDETPRSYAGERLEELLEEWENNFLIGLARQADYEIMDHESGKTNANTEHNLMKLGTEEAEDALTEHYACYIKLRYDENGFLEHVWVRGEDADTLLKNVQRVMKSRYLERSLYENLSYSAYSGVDWEGDIYYDGDRMKMRLQVANTPKNCTICYALTAEQMEEIKTSSRLFLSMRSVSSYYYIGIQAVFRTFLLILGLLALLLPLWKGYRLHERWILPLHLEIVLAALVSWFCVSGELAAGMVQYTMTKGPDYSLPYMIRAILPGFPSGAVEGIVLAFNLLFLALSFGLWYFLVTSLGQVYVLGIKRYLKKRSLVCRLFRRVRIYGKRKKAQWRQALLYADPAQDQSRLLLKLVVFNFLLIALISLFWIFGIFLLIPYSVLLYVLLRRYVSIVQGNYAKMLTAVQSVAAGNLQTEFEGDWGLFEPFKGELSEIQTGFSKAVAEEVKSQRMRTELITNVSHDLKTPLTAIITYISLLQEEDVPRERQREYLAVLERKAMRLKLLIEDLFELSKASSGNVTFHMERVDICHLLRQVYLEYEDKAAEAGLAFRFCFLEEKVYLLLDSDKTYRIFDNLYTNIIKYAMQGTRVYVSAWVQEKELCIELKNISGFELDLTPEQLTERFVRGDSARSSEGSGLGLAIAKSLAELQNGKMEIAVDGDLFKVTLRFPVMD